MKTLWKTLALALFPVSLWAATITGTVRDSTSNAVIANALVKITVGTATDSARTNATGVYTITNANLVAGTYAVNFSATGHTARNITGVTIATTGSRVTLNVRLLATATGGTLTGTVRDSTSNAVIANALVKITVGTATDSARTNATGVYTITNANLVAETYTVNFSATGYTARNITGIAITTGGTKTLNIRLLATTTGGVTFKTTELVRAADKSAVVAVIANAGIVARVKYGTQSGTYPNQTDSVTAAANAPIRVSIPNLAANTRYYYKVSYHAAGNATWTDRAECSFQTQRTAGTQFVFDITSDDHLNGTASSMYTQTITQAAADQPDFLFDLGDWYTTNYFNTQGGADTNAIFMRTVLQPLTPKSPVYLVNGNHEHEEGWFLTPNWASYKNVPVYSGNSRIKYFLNPAPDAFFSGDTSIHTNIGIIEGGHRAAYYSFVWGDALFIAIDPYFYTSNKPYSFSGQPGEPITTGDGNRWDWTLGIDQYKWLYNTLHNSKQKFKFVFSHQVTGGTGGTCNPYYGRGGVASIDEGFEWGGGTNWNQAGSDWSTNRPAASGWSYGPIHQMFKDNGVSIFFHGHDHLYVYETRDGRVYQECPEPTTNLGAECTSNYAGGTQAPSPGYLRVTVSSTNTKVEYVSNIGAVVQSYTVQPATTSVSPANKIPFQPARIKDGILSYSLDQESLVEFKIYDLLGKKLYEHQRLELAGDYTFSIKNLNLTTKSYVVHFKAGGREKRIKVTGR